MKQKKSKNILRLMMLLLIGCLGGISFWFMSSSIGVKKSLQGKVSLAYAEPGQQNTRPEIDLRVPENTEIALFAFG